MKTCGVYLSRVNPTERNRLKLKKARNYSDKSVKEKLVMNQETHTTSGQYRQSFNSTKRDPQ